MMPAIVVVLWLVITVALLVGYRRELSAAWREPVLREPVLILESDDWGYGPLLQAERLDRIADLLAGFRDAFGRYPVATLGVVLAGPDIDRMRVDGSRTYHRLTLADPRLAPVREAMVRGAARKVFALQLHGMEHFWPPCLMRSASSNEQLRQWLAGDASPRCKEMRRRRAIVGVVRCSTRCASGTVARNAPCRAAAARTPSVRPRAPSPRAPGRGADRQVSVDDRSTIRPRACDRCRDRRARRRVWQPGNARMHRGNRPANPRSGRAARPATAGHTPSRRSPGSAQARAAPAPATLQTALGGSPRAAPLLSPARARPRSPASSSAVRIVAGTTSRYGSAHWRSTATQETYARLRDRRKSTMASIEPRLSMLISSCLSGKSYVCSYQTTSSRIAIESR